MAELKIVIAIAAAVMICVMIVMCCAIKSVIKTQKTILKRMKKERI